MEMSIHMATSLALAASLYPFFGWISLFAVVGGFLIDIDHYFWYIYKTKKFSIKGCYDYYMLPPKKGNFFNCKDSLFVFHTIELIILIAILALFNVYIKIILLGLILHISLDVYYRLTKAKSLFLSQPSIIGYLFKSPSICSNYDKSRNLRP